MKYYNSLESLIIWIMESKSQQQATMRCHYAMRRNGILSINQYQILLDIRDKKLRDLRTKKCSPKTSKKSDV